MAAEIELEYRVRIPAEQFTEVLQKFQKEWKETSHVARLSYMCFFKQDDKQFDLRVRITNGEAETVLKVGGLNASDRLEMSQPIAKDQLVGLSRMFAHLPSPSYVAERETYNFETPEGAVVSLVNAGAVAYIEFELMSTKEDYAKNEKIILSIINDHGFTSLDEKGFDQLNTDLDKNDWVFDGGEEHVAKLQSLLSKY